MQRSDKPIDKEKTKSVLLREDVPSENGGNKFLVISKVKAAIWTQVLIAIVVDICPFMAGVASGFIGIYLPDIREDSKIQATVEQGSWIASLPGLGCIIGALLSALTSERLGRKRTLQICTIPLIVGWGLVGFANNVHVLYAGRVLLGVGNGMQAGNKQVYFSEIFDVRMRGLLSSTSITFANMGMLFTYILALGVTWRTVAKFCSVLSGIALVCYFFIPETPTWLIKEHRLVEAKKSLEKVRATASEVDTEFEDILRKENQNKIETDAAKGNWKQLLSLYFSRQALKAFGILFLIYCITKFAGNAVIRSYLKDILNTATNGEIDAHTAAIISGVIRVVMSISANILISSVSKKLLYGVSGTGMVICLFGMATYDYFSVQNGGDIGYYWIPGVCVCAYIAFITPGFLTVTAVLVGELFPQRNRGTMSSILTLFGFVIVFVSVKTYPDLESAVHLYGAFWIYSTLTFIGTIFIVFVVPETSGKTLRQIENDVPVKQSDKIRENNNNKSVIV